VTFERPTSLPILFAVQIADNPSLPSNIESLVKAAIIAAFNGADGGSRARIGSDIFASRYYGPVSLVSAAVSIISILIGTATPNQNSVQVGIDQVPTISEADISVSLV
jgi:small basic protein